MSWKSMLRAFARAAAMNEGSGKQLIDDAANKIFDAERGFPYGKMAYDDAQLKAYKALQQKRPGVSAEKRMSELSDADAQEEWDRAFDYAVRRIKYDAADKAGTNRLKTLVDTSNDDINRESMIKALRDKQITPSDIFSTYRKNHL